MTESVFALWRDARKAGKEGPEGIARRQRERLAELVAYARARSPYFAELYRDLPGRVEDPTLLPVTSKASLMPHFDEWLTDRTVTRAQVHELIDDPRRVGENFRGKYLVATTSGTSGTRGIFLIDDRAADIAKALGAARVPFGDLFALARGGMRTAAVIATGGHYTGYAGAIRSGAGKSKLMRVVSVHLPVDEIVAQLNDFRPALLVGYASTLKVLASEQEAGRLRIRPAMVTPGGEGLTVLELDRLASVFGARGRPAYAATECSFLAGSCAEYWYHVNADWFAFEPVDASYRPTPPGELSHTVLMTNLANRVQPFLRYDLGDSILVRPDRCPCGNPMPAVRVQGRTSELLTFAGGATLAPLALSSLLDRVAGLQRVQVVQTSPTSLRVRMLPAPDADAEKVWRTTSDELERLLAANKLTHVTLERATEPPEQTAGGKYRAVIPLI